MKAKITVLGCGNSTGVPAIGNAWGKCDPAEPRNRRTRASIILQTDKMSLIVDTGPDFHHQFTRENILTVDAVLYTHAHADHISGIEELRVIMFRNKKLVPVYGNAWTIADLKKRYDYMFKGGSHEVYPPVIAAHEITPDHFGKPMKIGDVEFIPFEQDHKTCMTVGYRFGDFGYSTDIFDLDDAAINVLKGVKTWIVDATGYKDSPAEAANKPHATLETVFRLNKAIGAGQVYLTGLSLGMDYRTMVSELPEGYAPAWDGLVLEANL